MNATLNITETLSAQKDAYAKRQGDFLISGQVTVLDTVAMWEFLCRLGDLGKMFRVVYVCRDGSIRDMIGRGGVYGSSQDGTVAGIGRPMRSESALTVSFWTNVFGGAKVNTGAGKGYRTLRAAGVLALRCEGRDFLTPEGIEFLRNS